MPITEQQRIERRLHIGSSDAAAIVGFDPWRTRYDVWTSKVETLDDAGNDATEAGNLLEEAVLNWGEQQTGRTIRRNIRLIASCGILAANLDGLDDIEEVWEAKTTGITGPADHEYGDELDGPDVQLPFRVLIQTHHQMFVSGANVANVPVLIGGKGFRLYRVDRQEELATAIAEKCRQFWHEHVLTRTPPTDCGPSLEVAKRIRREPGKVVDVSADLVDAWTVANAAKKQAKEDEEAAKAKVLAALGDAEGARFPGGMLTYFEQSRKGHVVKPSKFRVLRIKAQQTQPAPMAAAPHFAAPIAC